MRNKKEVENTFEVTTKESIHLCAMGDIHLNGKEVALKSFLQFIRHNSSTTGVINYEQATVVLCAFPDLSIDPTFKTLEIIKCFVK